MQRILKSVLALAAATIVTAIPVHAQSAKPNMRSRLDVALSYQATVANLIDTSRFTLQGGALEIHGRIYGGWGAVADIAGAHRPGVAANAVGLDLVTATFGPRYTWSPARHRYEFFAQGLAGEAFGMNSIFPNPAGANTVASSLAVKAGGGMNLHLTRHFGLRLFEADYLRTQLPNSTNNVQNNMTLGAGIVLR